MRIAHTLFVSFALLSSCASDPKPNRPETALGSARRNANAPIPTQALAGDAAFPTGEWLQQRPPFALRKANDESGTCEVWNTTSRKRVSQVDDSNLFGGGSEGACVALSPSGTLVEFQNSRRRVWKRLDNTVTPCEFASVAGDDATCIQQDSSPFEFGELTGAALVLPLRLCGTAYDGTCKDVIVLARGRNRVGPDGARAPDWKATYCSSNVLAVETPGSLLILEPHSKTVTHQRKLKARETVTCEEFTKPFGATSATTAATGKTRHPSREESPSATNSPPLSGLSGGIVSPDGVASLRVARR